MTFSSSDDLVEEDVVVTLPAGLDAPAVARRFVSDHRDHLPAATVDDALLLVSELVTNAVRYGRPDITLRVRTAPPGIGIAVHDDGEMVPTLPDGRPDSRQPSGRGLLILDAVATSWGVTPSRRQPGKTIWFDLAAR